MYNYHVCEEIHSDMKARKSPKDKNTGLPKKYVSDLTKKEAEKRKREFERKERSDNPDIKYREPSTNKGQSTKKSKHTKKFEEMYESKDTALDNKAEKAHKKLGVTKTKLRNALEKVYDRGMEAWVTGHRPGASQHQWAMGRVNSFLTKGKTYYTTDRDITKGLGLLKEEKVFFVSKDDLINLIDSSEPSLKSILNSKVNEQSNYSYCIVLDVAKLYNDMVVEGNRTINVYDYIIDIFK